MDGEGVTTLVVFMQCPLRCRYCLNPQTLDLAYTWKEYSPQALFDELKVDNLYFLATGGGVCFGGGEPLLQSTFIREFRELCGSQWKITLETSLNVPQELLRGIMDMVDRFIIDIKDINADIYRAYTGMDNSQVLSNLALLSEAGLAGKCEVRVPLIPGYNTEKDRESSIARLKALGYTEFDLFTYNTEIYGKRKGNLQSSQTDQKRDCEG